MASKAVVAARRVHVERLLLRGYSCRQITKALSNMRVINPRTGRPWSLGTVVGDQQAIEDGWLDEAAKLRAERKARADAEIQELKRVAWADRDYKLVGELIKQERQLWGLDEPLEIKASVNGTMTHKLDAMETTVDEMEDDELDALIANLLEANGTPVDADAFKVIEGQYAIEADE